MLMEQNILYSMLFGLILTTILLIVKDMAEKFGLSDPFPKLK